MYTIELDGDQLEMVLDALRSQRIKCWSLANRPLQGYKVTEKERQKEWLVKYEEFAELETHIAHQTI